MVRPKLVFANNTISLWFSFLMIDLYFLVVTVNVQIFNPTTIPTGIPTSEAKAEIEIF